MNEFVEHITVDGERWDLLAALYLGDPYGYERILLANRDVEWAPELEGGIRLIIPLPAPADAVAIDDPGLPPWRRAGGRA